MSNIQNTPYFPVGQYFQRLFGEKVAKVSVSVAETCPNRSASNKLEPCIFCDEWGAAAYHLEKDRELTEQIRHNKKLVARRLKNKLFLVYFQSYTNTLDKVDVLRNRFEVALSEPDICGLIIGTRPDCLPQRIFPLLEEMCRRTYVMVELGIQSFCNKQLHFLKRGHSAEKNIEAIRMLHEHTDVDIGIHLIFGMPDETSEKLIETAQIINNLPISNVKLHNLHVLTNTPLEKLYRQGEFTPDDLETYADKVILFLRHLSPNIAVQRLTALANRWDELVAPQWTREKLAPINFIKKRMTDNGYRQGELYDANSCPKILSTTCIPTENIS